jgi:hypothetical protein
MATEPCRSGVMFSTAKRAPRIQTAKPVSTRSLRSCNRFSNGGRNRALLLAQGGLPIQDDRQFALGAFLDGHHEEQPLQVARGIGERSYALG